MSDEDRSWMDNRRAPNRSRGITTEFEKGVQYFIEFARAHPDCLRDGQIRCPCARCKNLKLQDDETLKMHLMKHGFVDNYKRWKHHGESKKDVVKKSVDNNPPRVVAYVPSSEPEVVKVGEEPSLAMENKVRMQLLLNLTKQRMVKKNKHNGLMMNTIPSPFAGLMLNRVPLIFMCYWGGDDEHPFHGPHFEKGPKYALRLLYKWSFKRLIDELYKVICLDRTQFQLEVICRYPHSYGNGGVADYLPFPIKDDNGMEVMFDVLAQFLWMSNLQLYVVIKCIENQREEEVETHVVPI